MLAKMMANDGAEGKLRGLAPTGHDGTRPVGPGRRGGLMAKRDRFRWPVKSRGNPEMAGLQAVSQSVPRTVPGQ